MKEILSARQPFNFESTVCSHGWYQLAPLQWDAEQKILSKPEQLHTSKVVWLKMQESKEGVAVEVDEKLTAHESDEIVQKVRWMFLLDSDLSEFYDAADLEPRLAHCRAKAYGRLLRSTTLFKDIVRVMMTTNIQWSGTKRLVGKLVENFGASLTSQMPETAQSISRLRAFPTSHSIASSDELTLRSLGLGYRAPYLLKLTQDIANGEIELSSLQDEEKSTEQLRKELLRLPGIGPYAAATMLTILGRYDYIGVDSEAMSSVSKYFYDGQPVGEKEVYTIFGKWGKYKALAYWFWDFSGIQPSPIEQYEASKTP